MKFKTVIICVACIFCLVPPAFGFGFLATKALAAKGAAAIATKVAIIKGAALLAKGAAFKLLGAKTFKAGVLNAGPYIALPPPYIVQIPYTPEKDTYQKPNISGIGTQNSSISAVDVSQNSSFSAVDDSKNSSSSAMDDPKNSSVSVMDASQNSSFSEMNSSQNSSSSATDESQNSTTQKPSDEETDMQPKPSDPQVDELEKPSDAVVNVTQNSSDVEKIVLPKPTDLEIFDIQKPIEVDVYSSEKPGDENVDNKPYQVPLPVTDPSPPVSDKLPGVMGILQGAAQDKTEAVKRFLRSLQRPLFVKQPVIYQIINRPKHNPAPVLDDVAAAKLI